MKMFITALITIFLTGCLYGKNKKINLPENVTASTKIKIVKNGKSMSKTIYVLNNETSLSTNNENIINYAFSNGKKFNSKSNIMIKFKNKGTMDIDSFAVEYGLKFIRRMNNGYMLFKNLDGNSLDKINSIVEDYHDKIVKISPDFIANMKPM